MTWSCYCLCCTNTSPGWKLENAISSIAMLGSTGLRLVINLSNQGNGGAWRQHVVLELGWFIGEMHWHPAWDICRPSIARLSSIIAPPPQVRRSDTHGELQCGYQSRPWSQLYAVLPTSQPCRVSDTRCQDDVAIHFHFPLKRPQLPIIA